MTDDLKKLAEAAADRMFFGPHKPECEIPADQTMTVRYGHALQAIEAALAAMGEREAVKAELWAVARDAKKRTEALLLAKSLREIAERKADELNHHPGRSTKPEELVEWKASDLIERMAKDTRGRT